MNIINAHCTFLFFFFLFLWHNATSHGWPGKPPSLRAAVSAARLYSSRGLSAHSHIYARPHQLEKAWQNKQFYRNQQQQKQNIFNIETINTFIACQTFQQMHSH